MTSARSQCAVAVPGQNRGARTSTSHHHWTLRLSEGEAVCQLSPFVQLRPPRHACRNPSHSNDCKPLTILMSTDQGRHLHVFPQLMLCPALQLTRHSCTGAKCLSFDWKDTFNKDDGQLNKEENTTSVYDIPCRLWKYIQSTINTSITLLILIPHVSQHTCRPSASNTTGLCVLQECKFFFF